jgi:predicted porin
MKPSNAFKLKPLLLAASLATSGSAWAQAAGVTNEAVLQRIEALAREIEQLKAQLKASEARAQQPAPAPVAAASAAPAAAREGAAARSGSVEGEAEGVDIVKTARATLNFYGMVDVGAEQLIGTLANNKDANAVRVSNGMITPHFGVRGNGVLVGGLRGLFNLEGSFAPDNGTSGIGGRLFGRQSWVGLSGRFGTVRAGRQYTMVRVGWEDANPYGTGNQGLRLLDPRISNPRSDNSISYLGKWGPVSAGLSYGTGWDAVNGNSSNTGPANAAGSNCPGEVPDNGSQCKALSAGVKFDGSSWGIAASYEKLNGGTANTFGGLTSPARTDTRAVLGGYYLIKGGPKLAAGWIDRKNLGNTTTPKSDMYWLQAVGIPLGGSYFVDALAAELKYENSANKATLVNLRGRYVLSQDTTLYVAVSNMDNSGTLALPATASTPLPTPKAGDKQTSVIGGVLYRF